MDRKNLSLILLPSKVNKTFVISLPPKSIMSMPSLRNVFLMLGVMGSLLLLPGLSDEVFGDKRSYAVQVAAYKDRQGAEKRVADLKRLGHGAFYRHEPVKGKGRWYRVYIEKFPSWKEAAKEAAVLKNLGLISLYTIRAVAERPPEGSAEMEGPSLAFFLHVSSFKEKSNGEKEAARLEALGQRGFLVRDAGSRETWYRVYLGEFGNEKAAREAGEALRQKGVISYFRPLALDRSALLKRKVFGQSVPVEQRAAHD